MIPKIRTSTENDAPEIARIHVETWRYAYKGIVPQTYLDQLSIEQRTTKWAEMLKKSMDGTLIAEIDMKPVGWISFGIARDEDKENSGEVYAIYVDHTHWNQGIGRSLIRSAEEKLQIEGMNKIVLWVLEANRNSRYFYSNMGYQPDDSSKKIVIGGRSLLEMRYAKSKCE